MARPPHIMPRPKPEFEERVVQIDRVARVVKGGRRFRFRATVVIGDKKGRVGLGIAKASEVQGAIQKAVTEAKKDMMIVPRIGDTIPFAVTSSFAGARVLLKPARPGTGIIAGGAIRPIVELSGITNILSKSLGSGNRINNAKATMVSFRLLAATDISKLTAGVPKAKTAEASPKKPAAKAAKSAAKKPAAKKPAAAKKQQPPAKKETEQAS